MPYDWLTPTPEERVTLDVDVLFGAFPASPWDHPLSAVRDRLARSPVSGALALSTRGALFDDEDGNRETVSLLRSCPELTPVGTVNLRNAVAAGERLDALAAQGVRVVRLFPAWQQVPPSAPSLAHTVAEAVRRDLVVLVDGDPRELWRVLRGTGARVVFLDLHAYLVADFVLMARSEPGFLTSTRLLSSPDSVERVAGEVGADRLVFGSRTPLYDLSPATLRLRYARVTDAERALIAGGTMRALLGMDADADR